MITVYQIQLSNTDINTVNSKGWDSVPKATARADMMLGARKWKEDFAKYYDRVYEIDTDDLDKAFDITNLWNENCKVTRVRRGSSTSVGDIFVKGDDYYIVDNFGFTVINKCELGA